MKCPEIHSCIRRSITLHKSFILQVIYILGFCKLLCRLQIKTTAKSIRHKKAKSSGADFLS